MTYIFGRIGQGKSSLTQDGSFNVIHGRVERKDTARQERFRSMISQGVILGKDSNVHLTLTATEGQQFATGMNSFFIEVSLMR